MTAPVAGGGVLAPLRALVHTLPILVARANKVGEKLTADRTVADLREAIRTFEAMAEALRASHSLFQQINRDDDGEDYLNLSCDGMDLLEPLLAALSGEAATPSYKADLEQANSNIVDEIRSIVGLAGKPGSVVEAVRNLVVVTPAKGGERLPTLDGFRGLHPETLALVRRFAYALACKLSAAEQKYGYSDGWLSPDWMDECRARLVEHVGKGDPRDVAAYCAFLWHHGEHTALSATPAGGGDEVVMPEGDVPAQARAWLRVCKLLDELDPLWKAGQATGEVCALYAIRRLASTGSAPAPSGADSDALYSLIRRFGYTTHAQSQELAEAVASMLQEAQS